MKVHEGIDGFEKQNTVVTIGMFDGLHLGHRALIEQTIALAKKKQYQSVVVTFWPHPRLVLGKNQHTLRFLSTFEERTLRFSELGVDHLVIVPFTQQLSLLTAKDFINQILVSKLGMKELVVGFNHRFGSDAHLHPIDYEILGKSFDFGVTRVGAVTVDGQSAGSSVIREHLNKGNIEQANKLLGYSFAITGRIVGGQQLGRTLGYPTANIEIEEPAKMVPLDGVYACKVRVLGKLHHGMVNIGFRPTVSKQLDARTVEVHIFDFNENIYSEEVVLTFETRIRPEMQFENIDMLKLQLHSDEMKVRNFFNSSND